VSCETLQGNVEKETKIRGTKAAKVALQALKRGQAAVTLEAKKPTSMRAASKLITTLSSFRTQGTPNRTKVRLAQNCVLMVLHANADSMQLDAWRIATSDTSRSYPISLD